MYSEEDDQGLIENTREKINEAREVFDLSPIIAMPKGVPKNPESCPVACGLKDIDESVRVLPGGVETSSGETARQLAKAWDAELISSKKVELPRILKKFVNRFDAVHCSSWRIIYG